MPVMCCQYSSECDLKIDTSCEILLCVRVCVGYLTLHSGLKIILIACCCSACDLTKLLSFTENEYSLVKVRSISWPDVVREDLNQD